MPNVMKARLPKLVDAILAQTKTKKLKWDIVNPDVFKTQLGDYVLTISKSRRGHASLPDYYITLYDKQGNPVEKFSDNDLTDFSPSDGYEGYFVAMDDLFSLAAGQATGADEAIDAVLDILTSGDL